jgi:hypothetical protein
MSQPIGPSPSPFDRLRRLDPAVLPIAMAGLVLVGAVLWLLTRPEPAPMAAPAPTVDLAPVTARLAALEARPAPAPAPVDLAPLAGRITALEGRPVPAPVDLAPLAGRITALEGRPVPAPVDLAPLAGRITALEGRPVPAPVDLGPLANRIAALEGRPLPAPVDLGPLAARIGALEARPAPDLSGLAPRDAVAALAQRVAALEALAQRLAALEGRAARLAALDAVRTALDAGQPLAGPLGGLPAAPAALTRFATAAPPTEASLRLSFDAAARAGRAASDPSRTGAGVMDSAASVLSGLVTVRRGDTLVWGDSALAEIEGARRAVEAGDLDAALARLKRLAPPVQEAMAGWIAPAEALLAARAALRTLAAG